jgi:hypothetical protein
MRVGGRATLQEEWNRSDLTGDDPLLRSGAVGPRTRPLLGFPSSPGTPLIPKSGYVLQKRVVAHVGAARSNGESAAGGGTWAGWKRLHEEGPLEISEGN